MQSGEKPPSTDLSQSKLTLRPTQWITIAAFLPVLFGGMAVANPFIQVEGSRWLEIESLIGDATITSIDGESQSVQQGDRFSNVGDRLITADASRSVLSVDTTVGFIDVFENTDLQIQELRMVADGGRVTKLQINQGQARLRVRPFTHESSELEIETPAGWSGVRGTEFGVTVHPDGKTGVATLEGAVVSHAQGIEVSVNEGFQTLIIPGEPPTEPTPIDDTQATRLTPYVIEWVDPQTIGFSGKIDPVSLLIIENEPQVVNRDGTFDVLVDSPDNRRIQATVVSPLGRQQDYELSLPDR
ncbi:MAG: FecR domain-containing protein [Merismopedia sp. SIO2A8]|nr:FecR domain-containing protein [Merismopedia sp. SIO2A8]